VATVVEQKLLPYNLEAERALLGSLLVDPEGMGTVSQKLPRPNLFYQRSHQMLFEVLLEMYDEQKPFDLLILLEELEKRGILNQVGGRETVMDLMGIGSPSHADYYADIVSQRAQVRRLRQAAEEVGGLCENESNDVELLTDRCEQIFYESTQERARTETFTIKELVGEAMDMIQRIGDDPDCTRGVSTGFHELDQLTAGLHPSELIILAARPSMGKTTLAMNIAEHVALAGTPVAIFSIEVARDQLVRNMLCSMAGVNSHDLRAGKIAPPDYEALWTAASQLVASKMFINDTPSISIMALRTAARRMKQQHDIGLIVIDYLQLMEASKTSGRDNRQQEITEITRGLKALGRELCLPVIALSQLNRNVDQREGHRPRMSDLRESGSIEQEADLILFLYRDEYYFPDTSEHPGKAEVIIAKQRHGPTGSVELAFTKECVRFRPLYPYGEV